LPLAHPDYGKKRIIISFPAAAVQSVEKFIYDPKLEVLNPAAAG